jgi:hypothetical protein
MGGFFLLRSCNTCDRTTRLIARTVSQEPTEALPPTEMAFTRLATPSAPARQVNQIRARRCIQPACHQPHSTHQGHSGSHPLFDRSAPNAANECVELGRFGSAEPIDDAVVTSPW